VEDHHVADGSLETRLRILEDERSIIKTLYQYGHALDYGDEEAYVDCFTDDGVFEVRRRVADITQRVVGKSARRIFVAQHSRAPEGWHKHMVLQPIIDVYGDLARCVSYALVLVDHDDRPLVRDFARYKDRFLRCEDGKWRIEERIAESESTLGFPLLAYARAFRPRQ
jgi:ketosteroid isomerase-like protein